MKAEMWVFWLLISAFKLGRSKQSQVHRKLQPWHLDAGLHWSRICWLLAKTKKLRGPLWWIQISFGMMGTLPRHISFTEKIRRGWDQEELEHLGIVNREREIKEGFPCLGMGNEYNLCLIIHWFASPLILSSTFKCHVTNQPNETKIPFSTFVLLNCYHVCHGSGADNCIGYKLHGMKDSFKEPLLRFLLLRCHPRMGEKWVLKAILHWSGIHWGF